MFDMLAVVSIKDLSWLIPWLPYIFGVIVVIATYWFKGHTGEIAKFKTILALLKVWIGNAFDGKLDKVFSVWIDCLEHVQKGEWTLEKAIEHFVEIVKEQYAIVMTASKIQTLTEVSKASLIVLNGNTEVKPLALDGCELCSKKPVIPIGSLKKLL